MLQGIFQVCLLNSSNTSEIVADIASVGLSVAMASQAVLAILVGILTVHFVRENRLVREGKKVVQEQPGFYYTL